MKDYLLLFNENEKLKRIINSDEFYDDEFKSTSTGERTLTFKMKDQVVDIEMGDKIGIFSEGKFDLFIVDQVEAETYYSTDIKVTCLHDFYSIQEQKAITQYYSEKATLREAITETLRGTEYVLGECPERTIKPIGPYLYKNPLWCIQDIVSNFNVEVDYSIELNENRNGISRKVLNVVNALGSDTGIRCSTDLNVSKIKRVQKKKFYTVMYGCGAEYQKDLVKYKYDFKDAVWTTPNNPADKPKGQEFVEDKEAIAKYGRKIGIFEDGRIKEPELLLKKTWEALQKNNKPFVSYELDIEELKTEDGYEHLNFKLGDLIILQNTIDNSRAKFRIVEDCKSIRNKYKRKIVVGEQVKGIFSGGDTGNSDGTEGPGGSVIEPGTGEDIRPPSIEEILPDTLPKIPIVTAHGLWKNVQLSWTYENKIYYDYEVYASRIRDFEPTVFHMIYSGKASAFLHEAGANETWYYRVRAVNSFGNATQFSEQVEVHTTKVSDGTQYFESAAIKDALIETLRLDRGWIGELDATYLRVKGKFTVVDGNDEETFKIGSFGEVIVKPSVFTLLANCTTNVPTKSELASAVGVANSYTDTQLEVIAGQIREKVSQTDYNKNNEIVGSKLLEIEKTAEGVKNTVTKIEGDYVTNNQLTSTADQIQIDISKTGVAQLIPNGAMQANQKFWYPWQSNLVFEINPNTGTRTIHVSPTGTGNGSFGIQIPACDLQANKYYTVCFWVESSTVTDLNYNFLMNGNIGYQRIGNVSFNTSNGILTRVSITFRALYDRNTCIMVGFEGNLSGKYFRISEACCYEGTRMYPYKPCPNEIYNAKTFFDMEGFGVKHDDGSEFKATPQELRFTDIQAKKKMAIKKGSLYAYDVKTGELMGMFASNKVSSTYKGVTTGLSGSAHYYAIGATKELTDDDELNMVPYILIAQQDLHNFLGHNVISGGINFLNTPCVFHKSALFNISPRFTGGFTILKENGAGMNIYHAKNSLYIESNLTLPTGGSFYGGGLYGGDVTSIGYTLNGSYTDVIKLYAGIQQVDFLTPLNMNGFGIYNSYFATRVINEQIVRKYKIVSSTFDEIEVVSPITRNIDSIGQLDVSNVTNKDEIMLDDDNADLSKLVTMIFKEVKELKAEVKRLKEGV